MRTPAPLVRSSATELHIHVSTVFIALYIPPSLYCLQPRSSPCQHLLYETLPEQESPQHHLYQLYWNTWYTFIYVPYCYNLSNYRSSVHRRLSLVNDKILLSGEAARPADQVSSGHCKPPWVNDKIPLLDLCKHTLNFLMENVNVSKHFNIHFDLSEFLNAATVPVYTYTFAKGLLISYVHVYKKNC